MAKSGTFSKTWPSDTWAGVAKSYNWTGNWARSGNTISLTNMKLWITIAGSAWGSSSDTVTVTGGSAQTVNWTASGAQTNTVSLNNTSFTVATSATSATITCTIVAEYTGSVTLTFDAGGSSPSGLTISNVDPHSKYIVADVSVAGWGEGGSTSQHQLELSVCTSTNKTNRLRNKVYASGNLETIQVDDLSTKDGTITITPNKRYYLTAYATNGSLDLSLSTFTAVYTPPEAAEVYLQTYDVMKVYFHYKIYADGGYYTKYLEYSYDDSGTWTSAKSVSTTSETSGTINFTLPDIESHKISFRLRCGSNYVDCGHFWVSAHGPISKIYVSQSGVGTLAKKMIISSNGIAERAEKMYGSRTGTTERVL